MRGQVPGRVAGRDDLHHRLPDAISMYNEAGYSPLSHRTRPGFGGGGDVSIVVAIVFENGGTATDLTVWTCRVSTSCTPRVT